MKRKLLSFLCCAGLVIPFGCDQSGVVSSSQKTFKPQLPGMRRAGAGAPKAAPKDAGDDADEKAPGGAAPKKDKSPGGKKGSEGGDK